MRYKSFRIKNFKGIKDTTVDMDAGNAAVFPFVGLNESGKTTILEAIHSFSPDKATSELVGGDETSGVPFKDRVPRHLISSFTGDVSVSAVVSISKSEIDDAIAALKDEGIQVSIPPNLEELVFERQQSFKNGDFQKNYFTLRLNYQVKTGRQKTWRPPTVEEMTTVRDVFYQSTPDIAYFPTFVFNFPKSIYLTEKGSEIDRFYRRVFQDILDYDGQGHTIEDNIVRRVREQDMIVPWPAFLSFFGGHDAKSKIQHVIDRASAVVTKVIFGRWNQIFGEDAKGKEVSILWDTSEGTKKDNNGALVKTNEHDVFIRFQIKEGTRRFDVNDRSLGFRWFFSFMMFTQFRVARGASRPMLFLFDEPASNLHAAAQQKLIESFPEIVKGEHTLIYTTHSHYMIQPRWLEQTFIVTNRSDTPLDSVLAGVSLDDESLDIKANRYRAFIDLHPNKTSYFQPILDRLEVTPSRFDMKQNSIVLEGKSDYYVLRYAKRLLDRKELPLLPGVGAGTFGALVSLHVGWNLKCLFVLDGDKQGKDEKKRYEADYGIPADRIVTIDNLKPNLKVIEDLFDADALDVIKKETGLTSTPKKGQILRFCQERLASDTVVSLGNGFEKAAGEMLDALSKKLG